MGRQSLAKASPRPSGSYVPGPRAAANHERRRQFLTRHEVTAAAAIDHARATGAMTLEAYPADTGGDRIPSAAAYRGTLSMLERAGFTVVARRHASASSAGRPIVRLDL